VLTTRVAADARSADVENVAAVIALDQLDPDGTNDTSTATVAVLAAGDDDGDPDDPDGDVEGQGGDRPGEGGLAGTGFTAGRAAAAMLLLLTAGIVLVLAARRRERGDETAGR
jgi:hypothetical protein